MELCPALGIPIPVGKDSMSMRTVWEEKGARKAVTAPLAMIRVGQQIRVTDVRVQRYKGEPVLTRVDPKLDFRWDRGGPTDDMVARGEMSSRFPIGTATLCASRSPAPQT